MTTNKITILADIQNILNTIRINLAKLLALTITLESKNLRISMLKFITDSANLNIGLLDEITKKIPSEMERTQFNQIMEQNFGKK